MTYPPPSEWQDPARSVQPSSAPPVDPTRSMSDPPVPAQPTGPDPYASAQPVSADPYAQAQPASADPYAQPQPASPDPYAQAAGAGPYAQGQPAGSYAPAGYGAPGYPAPGYPLAYAYPPVPRTNSLALVALILSVVGVTTCITAPIGAILGHVARRQIQERGEDGDGMAKAAIIVGWILTALIALGILAYVLLIVFAVSQVESTTY